MLDRGLDEPLLIGFIGSQAKHFILVMKYRNTGSGYQYLIYDPWDGICDYINESTIFTRIISAVVNTVENNC
jgi:hypothetical protein